MSIKTVRSPETDSKKPIACPHYLGLGYSWDHLVKDLDIFAKEGDIYSGATLKTLYQDYGDDSAFPLVHKFTLYLDSYHDGDSESLEDSEDSVDSDDAIHANIGAFVCWVKQVLPKVDEIWVILDNVLAGLCLDEIRNLASLDFRDEPGRSNSSEQCVQLARQNARTLQFLSLVSDQFNVWCVLLLALICPNFDYVSNHPSQRESFMEDLERAIDLDRFRPYAPRLRRLLFKGWRDC
ncbi:hypothetical protein IWW39_006107 [Coemansia spiralis]|uniref:Uncharacterized protein n=1 Tax=Coemansia spiralis TaxID=417178 RepID=A0A9W8GDZ2_9FUNG|nr:hypothetical protein IWW39_006107 [Coemansia spiralis]